MKSLICILSLVLIFNASCFSNKSDKKEILFKPGSGVVQFTEYPPLANRPIDVYYCIPEDEDIREMPVLMVMHSAARDPKEFCEALSAQARKYKVMIFVPGFTADLYPLRDYQEVGLFNKDQTLKPVAERTVSVIDKLFEYIRAHSEIKATQYDMYGHSAGGQFVHRFMLFHQSRYVNRAMIGSPGWYTFPDFSLPYPYGVKNTPFVNRKTVQEYLQKHIILQLGSKDTIRESFLRVTPEAEAQGKNRFERGQTFYRFLEHTAGENHWKFNWSVIVVPDVPHNSNIMGRIGMDYLYGKNATKK